MKNKKLPEIIITGTPQELVEIEPLLVMAGYDDHVALWVEPYKQIICYGDGAMVYSKHVPARNRESFKASEIHKILHYIETGEIKEYYRDTAYFKERQEWIERAIGKLEESSIKCITGKIPFYFDRGTGELSTKKPIKHTPEPKTHTGQAGVVGVAKAPSAEVKVKGIIQKMKLKKWKQVQKEFKQWADPKAKNCIGYYSPTSQLEILAFFKKQFIK